MRRNRGFRSQVGGNHALAPEIDGDICFPQWKVRIILMSKRAIISAESNSAINILIFKKKIIL